MSTVKVSVQQIRLCRMWLVAVVGRCLVGCEHCEGFCSTELVVLDVVGSGCGALSCRV